MTRSHLAEVLKGRKSLSPDKIRALAEVTGSPVLEMLDAAGYLESDSAIDSTLPVQFVSGTVSVVTDPKFLDSAIFFWLFESNAMKNLGVDWELRYEPWGSVPWRVQETKMTIGFFNRITQQRLGEKVVADPKYWADLVVYEGHALMARKEDAQELTDNGDIDRCIAYLNQLADRDRAPLVVTIDQADFDRIKTPLTASVPWHKFLVKIFDADRALEMFLEGHADLFVGGLPQRFRAQHEIAKECIPVLSIANDPFLFSINSLICSNDMFNRGKTLMSLVTAAWFQVCGELREKRELRTKMFEEINQMLTDRFRIADHSITEELIHEVFGADDDNRLEFFPRRPAGVVTRVMENLMRCAETSLERNQTDAGKALEAIDWIFNTVIERGTAAPETSTI